MNSLTVNLLSNLKNTYKRNNLLLLNKSNRYAQNILTSLKKSGLILGYKTFLNKNNILVSKIFAKKGPNGKNSFDDIIFFTKTKKTFWISYTELLSLQNSTFHGVLIVETSCKGLITHNDAIKYGLGGKLLMAFV